MKLRYENNWENDIYFVGKRKLATLEKVRIDGIDYKVKSAQVSVPYNDMGHQYSSLSTHYFVKARVFGKMMEFDLNTIKAPITVLKYTLEPDWDSDKR